METQKIDYFGIGPKIFNISGMCILGSILIGNLSIKYTLMFYLGLVVMTIGILLYIFTLKVLYKGLRKGKLVTTFPYSYCRNPIYSIIIFFIIPAIAMMFNSWSILFASVLTYIFAKLDIHHEYDKLDYMFGSEWRKYRDKTKEFFL